ncbi:efflux RND transporter periplasmic adaptor subunit [Spirosoma sp. HMF3257]|uniref:Efflux RND transporter periplasmic adaptor subunit n=1 Tax=Spirosoma telluris TaxID=2183553 RepID=A0A327NPU2_9BACT|nr:efflux RND transporter periplasmic adaptor subunit [Spirosoma telluris]RAI75804.1 efflux RND transporter periplasmic adaptor subunit [Spirosoma telluris]
MRHELIGLIIVLSACSQEHHSQPESLPASVRVQTQRASTGTNQYTARYSGIIEARQVIPLSFASPGTVTAIAVQEGQAIRKGQLVGQVDAATAKNTYQLALQKQQQAQDAYNRLKPMNENGTLPEIKWVEAQTGLAQAKTAVAIAQKGITDCHLYAPEPGIIGRKLVLPGMNVLPGTPVLELLDVNTVYARIAVPENEISAINKGASAQATIQAIGKSVSGTVQDVGVSADPLSHTYPVKIQLSNSRRAIKPGMLSDVRLNLSVHTAGLLISNKALQQEASGQEFVYVIVNRVAQKRAVKTLALVDQQVLVTGELQRNEDVVVAGQSKLSPGTQVQIIH